MQVIYIATIGDSDISAFINKYDALQYASMNIINYINEYFNFSKPLHKDAAIKLLALCKDKRYNDLIQEFNNFMDLNFPLCNYISVDTIDVNHEFNSDDMRNDIDVLALNLS